jgi:hypothetical protein
MRRLLKMPEKALTIKQIKQEKLKEHKDNLIAITLDCFDNDRAYADAADEFGVKNLTVDIFHITLLNVTASCCGIVTYVFEVVEYND